MPQGLTRAALGLAVACAVALGASFAIARPDAERETSVGTKPVSVAGEASFETPRLGPVKEVPALADPPAPEPVPVVHVKKAPTRPAEPLPQPDPPRAQPSVTPAAPAPVVPEPQAVQPAPAPPVPAQPAPSPPPPPAPEPALSFDDSG